MSNVPVPEAVEPEALDIQHDTDPAQDHGPSRRIPHMGHAVLFFSMAFSILVLCEWGVFNLLHLRMETAVQHPFVDLAAEALGDVLLLSASVWLFSRLWERPFLEGIQWNFLAVRRNWYWVVAGGILLSVSAQFFLQFLPVPKSDALDSMGKTPLAAWVLMVYAVVFAPLVEELAFRGFLLPALATAYDWLALERSPAGIEKWQRSSLHSVSAMVFAAIFSSIPFALLHGAQLSYAWGVLGVLYGVSLVLSFVRIKTHSLACSVLMHATYNFSIFFVILITTAGFQHLEKLPH